MLGVNGLALLFGLVPGHEVPRTALDAWEKGFQALYYLECEWTLDRRDKFPTGWQHRKYQGIASLERSPRRGILIHRDFRDGDSTEKRAVSSGRALLNVRKAAKHPYELMSIDHPEDLERPTYFTTRARVPAFAYSFGAYTLGEYVIGPGFRLDEVTHRSPTEVVFAFTSTGGVGRLGDNPGAKYRLICNPQLAWARTWIEVYRPDAKYRSTIEQRYRGKTSDGWPLLSEVIMKAELEGNETLDSKMTVTYIGPSRRKEAEFTPEYYGLPSTIFDQISGPAPQPWWWTYGLWSGIGVGLLIVAGWLWRRSTVARHG